MSSTTHGNKSAHGPLSYYCAHTASLPILIYLLKKRLSDITSGHGRLLQCSHQTVRVQGKNRGMVLFILKHQTVVTWGKQCTYQNCPTLKMLTALKRRQSYPRSQDRFYNRKEKAISNILEGLIMLLRAVRLGFERLTYMHLLF